MRSGFFADTWLNQARLNYRDKINLEQGCCMEHVHIRLELGGKRVAKHVSEFKEISF